MPWPQHLYSSSSFLDCIYHRYWYCIFVPIWTTSRWNVHPSHRHILRLIPTSFSCSHSFDTTVVSLSFLLFSPSNSFTAGTSTVMLVPVSWHTISRAHNTMLALFCFPLMFTHCSTSEAWAAKQTHHAIKGGGGSHAIRWKQRERLQSSVSLSNLCVCERERLQ